MPSIPGLDEWVRRFPGLIRHSRQYRRPEAHANQTVLIVGAVISGSEISRDLNRHTGKIYQSFRPDTDRRSHYRLENFVPRIPRNTTLVGEIKQFLPIHEGSPVQAGLVELKNGTVLSGIDGVMFATGFRYSFPYLPQYYDGATYVPHKGSARMDPTLAFIGMTRATQIFVFSDYTMPALAKVWSNAAKLPNSQTMGALHDKIVEERGGYGKHVMFLGPERTIAISRYLVGWLNEAGVKYGGKQIDGFPTDFRESTHYFSISLYGGPLQETIPEGDGAALATLGLGRINGMDQGRSEYYDDAATDW